MVYRCLRLLCVRSYWWSWGVLRVVSSQLLESKNGGRGSPEISVVHGATGRLVCVVLLGTWRSRMKKGWPISAKWCSVGLSSLLASSHCHCRGRCWDTQVPHLPAGCSCPLSLADWEHPAGLDRTRCLVSAPGAPVCLGQGKSRSRSSNCSLEPPPSSPKALAEVWTEVNVPVC